MNVRFVDIETKDIPSAQRTSGKWYMVWLRAKDLPLNKSVGVVLDKEEDVERARTAIVSYSRRAKESWRIATHTTQTKPKMLYLTKVRK